MQNVQAISRHRRSGSGLRITQLALLVLAATLPWPAYAGFGDILDIKGNSPFPPGWVVIGVRGEAVGLLSAGPIAKPSMASMTFTIMDVTGAAKGHELEVRGNSPIPVGWVILKTKWPTALSVGRFSCPDWEAVHTIKCLVESVAKTEN